MNQSAPKSRSVGNLSPATTTENLDYSIYKNSPPNTTTTTTTTTPTPTNNINKSENSIINIGTLINSVLLTPVQITNLQILKFTISLLGFLILLLHVIPISIILIVLLILFIIFTIIYVIIYSSKFSIANRPINSNKLQNLRNEFGNYTG